MSDDAEVRKIVRSAHWVKEQTRSTNRSQNYETPCAMLQGTRYFNINKMIYYGNAN